MTDINGMAMEKSVVIFDSVSLMFQNSFIFVVYKYDSMLAWAKTGYMAR
jgi:hypothetical protein